MVTTWRSGSTFLGDLLMSPQAAFYHYEPLLRHGISRYRDINKTEAKIAIDEINKLFSCNYDNMGRYITSIT